LHHSFSLSFPQTRTFLPRDVYPPNNHGALSPSHSHVSPLFHHPTPPRKQFSDILYDMWVEAHAQWLRSMEYRVSFTLWTVITTYELNGTHAMQAHWVRWNPGPVFHNLWTKVHKIKYACTGEIAVCNAVFPLTNMMSYVISWIVIEVRHPWNLARMFSIYAKLTINFSVVKVKVQGQNRHTENLLLTIALLWFKIS